MAEKYKLETLEELQLKIECAHGCRFCVPYIVDMLNSGETEFDIK